MSELNEEEAAVVALVRDFVNREVKPAVRDLEHANTYPAKLIDQMRQMGIFGLAIPEPWGEDAPLMIVGEGTNEIQRNVITRQLIKRSQVSS